MLWRARPTPSAPPPEVTGSVSPPPADPPDLGRPDFPDRSEHPEIRLACGIRRGAALQLRPDPRRPVGGTHEPPALADRLHQVQPHAARRGPGPATAPRWPPRGPSLRPRAGTGPARRGPARPARSPSGAALWRTLLVTSSDMTSCALSSTRGATRAAERPDDDLSRDGGRSGAALERDLDQLVARARFTVRRLLEAPAELIALGAQGGVLGSQGAQAAVEVRHRLAEGLDHDRLTTTRHAQALDLLRRALITHRRVDRLANWFRAV